MTDEPTEPYDAEETELVHRAYDELHAIQSGVKALMQLGEDGSTSPKHLRVGVNSAMCNHGALVDCLVTAGVITRKNYLRARARFLEIERIRYQDLLSTALKKDVKLL